MTTTATRTRRPPLRAVRQPDGTHLVPTSATVRARIIAARRAALPTLPATTPRRRRTGVVIGLAIGLPAAAAAFWLVWQAVAWVIVNWAFTLGVLAVAGILGTVVAHLVGGTLHCGRCPGVKR
jgi:hypothetical protein